MPLTTLPRFISSLEKSALILDGVLKNVTQTQAETITDGPDGWNITEIVCHLRDFEEIFFQRAKRIQTEENPTLIPVDHEKLAIESAYAKQNLTEVLGQFHAKRAEFIAWLRNVPESDWQRTGIHPEFGSYTLLEQAMQNALHTIDHIEQLVHTLAAAEQA